MRGSFRGSFRRSFRYSFWDLKSQGFRRILDNLLVEKWTGGGDRRRINKGIDGE